MSDRIMVCGVDCVPNGKNCNNYCNARPGQPMPSSPAKLQNDDGAGIEITGVNRGGAACAKEALCGPPAQARATNRARLAQVKAENAARLSCVKAENEERLMKGMCEGLSGLTELIKFGTADLSGEQERLYHRAAAVLDQPEAFVVAFDKLRESLIDPSAKV